MHLLIDRSVCVCRYIVYVLLLPLLVKGPWTWTFKWLINQVWLNKVWGSISEICQKLVLQCTEKWIGSLWTSRGATLRRNLKWRKSSDCRCENTLSLDEHYRQFRHLHCRTEFAVGLPCFRGTICNHAWLAVCPPGCLKKEEKEEGRGIRWQHQGQRKCFKKEPRPQLWLIRARRRRIGFTLTFIVGELLPFDLWITSGVNACRLIREKRFASNQSCFFSNAGLRVCSGRGNMEIVCAAWNVLLRRNSNHCQSFGRLSWIIGSAGGGTTEYVKVTFRGVEEERSQLVPSSSGALNHSWRFNSLQSQINSQFCLFFLCKSSWWLGIVCRQ